MTLESKKELLRYKILNTGIHHDIILYSMLRYQYFDEIISKINDISISFKIDVQEEEIEAEQFLVLLEKFVKEMKNYFFNIGPMIYTIDNIVEPNIDKMKDYLSLKCDIKENEEIVLEKIYKIIISNFINNAEYIPSIKTFLEEHHIEVKPIDEYTFKESKKIISLLSDLVFCQRGRGKLSYLFENLDLYIKGHIEMSKYRQSKKSTPEYFQKHDVECFNTNYESIFKTYNSKKKYLRYFE